jgi:hypothetical protein
VAGQVVWHGKRLGRSRSSYVVSTRTNRTTSKLLCCEHDNEQNNICCGTATCESRKQHQDEVERCLLGLAG